MEVELKGDASSVRTTRLWGFPISVRSELSQETAGSEDPRGRPLATMSLGAPGFPGAKSTVSRTCAVSVCSGHRDNATDRGAQTGSYIPTAVEAGHQGQGAGGAGLLRGLSPRLTGGLLLCEESHSLSSLCQSLVTLSKFPSLTRIPVGAIPGNLILTESSPEVPSPAGRILRFWM